MRNTHLRKSLFIAGAVGLLGFILLAGRSFAVTAGSTQTPHVDDRVAVMQALRRDGLRGAAKLKGHYVEDFDPHWDFGAFDIESLTRNSAAVVVGVVGPNLGGHLTESGLAILTDYKVIVQENVKGGLIPGSVIILSLPGGRVQFEDGTTAELLTPKFEQVKTGGSYTFFLTEFEQSAGVYTLTGGPQGLVEFGDNGSVKSHGRATDPIAEQTKEKDKQSFLKDVREKAKKWPDKGKCCS